jgi:hypothetical protein
MDNASNNQTFMECLKRLLAERAIIDFCAKNNYIRCFSHIVNLCSQACIKAMEADNDTSTQYLDTDTDSATETDTPNRHTSDSAHSPRQKNPEIWPNLSRKKNSSIHSQIGSAPRLIVGNN